ncbi:MAG: GtrA family protein [Acidimicrobiales bacterium]|jgi:putative flippase GtrA
MAWLARRVRAFRESEHFRRIWKYASVSIITTCVSQVVLFVTYHIWDVGHSAMVCNVIATAVASVPAYYLNRTWTWGKTGRSRVWGEVVPFWTISFIAMVLSTGSVGLAAHNADRIASGSLARALIVNGANLLTYAIIWTVRYFILNHYLFGARTQQRNVTVATEHDGGLVETAATAPAPVADVAEPSSPMPSPGVVKQIL